MRSKLGNYSFSIRSKTQMTNLIEQFKYGVRCVITHPERIIPLLTYEAFFGLDRKTELGELFDLDHCNCASAAESRWRVPKH